MGARDVKVSVIKKIKFNLVVIYFSLELKLNIANLFFFSDKERCIGPTGDPIQ